MSKKRQRHHPQVMENHGNVNISTSDADAVFIGWQQTSQDAVIPLYNIVIVGHPQYGSTITNEELHRLHLHIPPTPPPPETMNITCIHKNENRNAHRHSGTNFGHSSRHRR